MLVATSIPFFVRVERRRFEVRHPMNLMRCHVQAWFCCGALARRAAMRMATAAFR